MLIVSRAWTKIETNIIRLHGRKCPTHLRKEVLALEPMLMFARLWNSNNGGPLEVINPYGVIV